MTLLFHLTAAERGLQAETTATGARYWEFPASYPDAIAALRGKLVAQGAAP